MTTVTLKPCKLYSHATTLDGLNKFGNKCFVTVRGVDYNDESIIELSKDVSNEPCRVSAVEELIGIVKSAVARAIDVDDYYSGDNYTDSSVYVDASPYSSMEDEREIMNYNVHLD